MQEIWKAAKGYEGYLEVSTLGNVRSIDRMITVHDGLRIYEKPVEGKEKSSAKMCKPDICRSESGTASRWIEIQVAVEKLSTTMQKVAVGIANGLAAFSAAFRASMETE